MMSRGSLLGLAWVVLAALPSTAWAERQLVRAAPVAGHESWSPRRLFNAALAGEQRGDLMGAVQLYLSARLSRRESFADQLYARGAGLRLVRVLAGVDDDAATAAALMVSAEAERGSPTDLAPLIRSLLHRLENAGELEVLKGTIAAVRFHKRLGCSIVEVEDEHTEERRVILAEGTIGPFSAGDLVRMLVKKDQTRALASWRMVAVGPAEADGWQVVSVQGLAAAQPPTAKH
jgi:hypothetical protein